ncbi:hypothetical protein DH2020_030651 [Rehmannia glutinosa]|uniref:Response regulatory domain-containing protein n=1 Tax=Rehmannia glutinosa TaxID=99300 RepID=A0ABR0VLY4_REHGL
MMTKLERKVQKRQRVGNACFAACTLEWEMGLKYNVIMHDEGFKVSQNNCGVLISRKMIVDKIRGGNENGDNFPVGMRVLAVDDDPICLKLLETLLRKCQYHGLFFSLIGIQDSSDFNWDAQCTSFPLFHEFLARMALKMLRENKDRFDLVISDVHMPDMDGFKLLELVGLEMDLPVIMLSANGDPKLVMKGVTHGACDYLVKPVRIEELRNIWQHVIRRTKCDSKNQNKSADQVKANPAIVEGQGSPVAGNADQNGKINRKRKDEEDESEDGNEKAVPKKILDLMNVEGLTRKMLYLKRISSVATQQANMAAALGVKDSPFMRIGPFEGLGDFRTLAGPGRLTNAALSHYSTGGMLGRLNTPANVNLRNLTPSPFIQPSHAQNPNNSITTLGKIHPSLQPANPNPSLFQGIPSSLELDQLQQNNCATGIAFNGVDDSRLLGNQSNVLNGTPSNTMVLNGKYQQTLNSGGFGNQSFNVGVDGSPNLLNTSAIESSRMQPNSLLSTEPFQLPMNSEG